MKNETTVLLEHQVQLQYSDGSYLPEKKFIPNKQAYLLGMGICNFQWSLYYKEAKLLGPWANG